MDYVKINMNNKDISSDQCLNRIIDYFENVKGTVEKELSISNFGKKSKPKEEKELTEFTNQMSK